MSETPQWMLDLPVEPKWRGALRDRLIASYQRISDSVRAEQELAAERISALEWCRANGNPHRVA